MKKKHFYSIIFILILDQVTKIAVDASMNLHESISVIDGFFQITYARNTGAAWSMLEGKMIFFYLISLAAIAALSYFYWNAKEKDVITKWGIIFMLAGTIGNLIDRIAFRYVRDFLDFNLFGYDFPIFNIADSALCIGVALIFIDIIKEMYGAKKQHES